MPSVSDIPGFFSRVRHPRRSRSISIGPQSAADAHEALAFRREMRKERQASASGTTTGTDASVTNGSTVIEEQKRQMGSSGHSTLESVSFAEHAEGEVASTTNSNKTSSNTLPPLPTTTARSPSQDRRQNEKEERELFSSIPKPRVRYDVEVITKLVVYSGRMTLIYAFT